MGCAVHQTVGDGVRLSLDFWFEEKVARREGDYARRVTATPTAVKPEHRDSSHATELLLGVESRLEGLTEVLLLPNSGTELAVGNECGKRREKGLGAAVPGGPGAGPRLGPGLRPFRPERHMTLWELDLR